MLSWSKSNRAAKEAAAKTKPTKEPKQQIVIVMPRTKKEFGMDTFGKEHSDDLALADAEQTPYPPSLSQEQREQQQAVPMSEMSNALCYDHSGLTSQPQQTNGRRDQPLGTPATPGSTGLATPHSTRTSYFPATPASGNTVSTNDSAKPASTTTFGGHRQSSREPRTSSRTESDDHCTLQQEQEHQVPLFATSLTTSPSQGARRPKPPKCELPPSIATSSDITIQTPSTPHGSTLFSPSHSGNNSHAFAARIGATSGLGGSHPTPTSSSHTATMWATPKSPSSMSEWRMMQMELQEQDDLNLSLTTLSPTAISSASACSPSFSYSNPRMLASPSLTVNGTGLTPMSVVRSSTTSASASSCSSCCCCNYNTSSPCTVPATVVGSNGVQDANLSAPAITTTNASTMRQHHSFLLHSESSRAMLEVAASLADESGDIAGDGHHVGYSGARQSWAGSMVSSQRQSMYNHCNNSNLSNDYFSSRELHSQGMAPGHGLGLTLGTTGYSTVTLHSEYPPSSVDQSEGIACRTQKHCSNCPQSRQESMTGGTVFTTARPVSGLESESETVEALNGSELDLPVTNTGPTNIEPTTERTPPSSSGGPFRNFSSRLAANALKRLSISQRSLFGDKEEPRVTEIGGESNQDHPYHCNGSNHHQGIAGGSMGSDREPGCHDGNGSSTKLQRSRSRLGSFRCPAVYARKDNKSRKQSRDMEYNCSNSIVRQEFARYNSERQMEDFQRAARVFKEQQELAEVSAGAVLVTEEAYEEYDDSLEDPNRPSFCMNSANQGEDSRKHRTRSLISSALSGLFESVSHRHRSVDSNTEGTNECDKEVAMVIAPCQTTAYLELSHESNGMETNETLLGLGIGSGLGIDTTKFDSYSNHGPSTSQSGGGNAANTKEISPLEVRSASISSRCDRIPGMSEDSPVRVMTGLGSFSMIHSGGLPKALISDYNYKRRPSNLSLDARRVLNGPGRGNHGPIRSVRSVGSIDFVSQQIAARHHQHSQLAGQPSIVASLHARSQAIRSNCESISDRDSNASDGGDEGGELGASTVLENSPIQVVRATVGTVDDPSLPCFTFRMWVLSTVFVIMGAVISEYNFFRKHSVYFSIYFVQLASHFCGKAMARWLPTREFEIRIPDLRWMFRSLAGQSTDDNKTGDLSGLGVQGRNVPSIPNGVDNNQTYKDAGGFNKKPLSWRFTLNPGKFNMKEHMLIGIAAAAGCSPAYATNVIGIQSLVFDSPLDNLTGLGLVVSSQCIGFSMAWFLFDFVIKPSAMIWPSTLVNVSLYNTLHEHKVLTRWFTRMQLFWCAFFAIFLYQWLPRMFMPVLSSMALLCWIQPSNNILRKLGSGHTGLGIGCISLDWSIISGVGPLYTPWWAQCNFFFGLIAVLWVVTPVMYFSNYWSAMSYPIVSSNLYDNQAQLYEVSRILNRDLSFNATLYESYSRVAMTPYFAITYGTSFMAVIATFVHVALYYGADIWLITRTRCERKMRRIRQSGLMKSATGFFQPSNSGASVDEGASTLPAEVPLSGLDAPNPEFASNRPGHGPSSRRGSNTTQFRNDDIATCGRDSEDIGSPRYAQSTQQQSPFAMGEASARSRRGSKAAVVDDRDQIPTEKFGKEDIHTTLMRAYPEIPGWWFGVTFIICFAMAVVVCVNTEIQLPVGALLLALILAAVFAIPMAIIQALSSSQIGLNVLSEVVCGYLLPGNQLANSVFKCYSYMALYQCLNLTQGFKLGHYMKVPPRKIFIAVVYGTVVGAFVNVQVMEWVMLYNRAELFDHSPRNGWSFRNLDLFFSASLLWGAISPTRLFEEGSIYHFLPYCFLIGVILPIPFYVMHRYFPPYGSMCKGNSVFPFMPKCTCPASHIAASSADDGMSTISIFPSTFRGGPGVKDLIDPENNLEKGGRSSLSRVLEKCWSFRGSSDHCHRSTLESHAGLDATTERGVNPDGTSTRRGSTTCSPLAQEAYNKTRTAMGVSVDEDIKEGSIRSSNSVSSDDTSEPAALEEIPQDAGCHRPPRSNSPHTPHIYYGRSDSVWEHRLRRVPWHLINTPLICVGASFVPQAPASFVVSAGVVAFCFAFLVLRYNHEWWRRYTFVLAAALDAGTQICNMAIFVVFSLILRGVIKFPVWLGNDAVNVEQCGVGDGVN